MRKELPIKPAIAEPNPTTVEEETVPEEAVLEKEEQEDQEAIDSLGVYLKKIDRYPLLQKEQVPIIFKAYRKERAAEKEAEAKLLARLNPQQEMFAMLKIARMINGSPHEPEKIAGKIGTDIEDLPKIEEEIVTILRGPHREEETPEQKEATKHLSPLEKIFFSARKTAVKESGALKELQADSEFWSHTTKKNEEKFKTAFAESKSVMDMITNCNLKLVVSIAKKHKHVRLTWDDRIQAGYSGLRRAIEKFDPAMKFEFSTYAAIWIKQLITREIDDTDRMIRFPRHIEDAITKARKITDAYLDLPNKNLTTKILVQELMSTGIHEESATKAATLILEKATDTRSLNARSINKDNDSELADFIPDSSNNTEEEALRPVIRQEIFNALSRLSEMEKAIVQMHANGMSLAEIGKRHGIGYKKVSRIRDEAISKLQKDPTLQTFV